MMGTVQFVGQAPFAMPMTQHTRVIASGDVVEARIRLLIDPRTLEDVILTLTPQQALLLAGQLASVVQQIDSKG